MMSKRFILYFLFSSSLLFVSCKKKVKLHFDDTLEVVGEKSYAKVDSPADSAIVDFKFLQAKMKVSASMNGANQNFNAVLRWEKGEQIWMSMSLFGIEGVRALINKDGVQWIDRLNNEYHTLPMSKIASKVNMDLDFKAIERILLGLPAIQDQLPTEITTSDEWIQWNTNHLNGYTSKALFNRINNMLIDYQAINQMQQRNLIAKYGDIKTVGSGFFAFERLIQMSQADAQFEMQSKFSDVAILDELTFPFDISDKYKKINY